jgi:uncharacterized membrane protein YtjA (UPF0391 family)
MMLYWWVKSKGDPMLGYTVTFLVIAIVAGILGLGLVAGLALEIARILFVVFLVLFIASLLSNRHPPV